MFAIETNGFCKRYGDVNAVTDLDLSVEEGSVFGFLGPNGAGKSTTIDALLGFLTPTSGEVRVLGADPATDEKAVRSRTGLLTDGFEPYENLTGRQHIDSAIRTKGADDDPDTILGRVGLSPEQAARNAGGYSKGMTQRLALGIALVGEPDLLVLDEPSGGLDPNGIKLLRKAIRVENERGATVFFSSHILDHVEQVCDRVGIMRDGSLVATDSIGNLRERLGTCAVEATVERVPDLEDIRRVEGVTDATISGENVHIVCARTEAKIRALVRLDELTTVRNFDTADSSLESLFEAFTDDDELAGDPTRTEAEVSGGERP